MKANHEPNKAAAGEASRLRGDIVRLKSEVWALEREAKGFLPKTFTRAYDELCSQIFGPGKGLGSQLSNVSDAPKQQLSDSYVTSDGGFKSEAASKKKATIDRKLRQLAREIRTFNGMDHSGQRDTNASEATRCSVCGKFVDNDWTHCAWCATRLKEQGDGPEQSEACSPRGDDGGRADTGREDAGTRR